MPDTQRQSPYQGLAAFEKIDSPYFFGREREMRLVIANLFASPLTILYGASGAGKSSVLRAGVADQLHQRNDILLVVFNAWEGDPVIKLKLAIKLEASSVASEIEPPPSSLPLVEYLVTWGKRLDRRLMIILDQFEEYFLYHPQDDTFSSEFSKGVTQRDIPISFLISTREDSVAKLDRFKGRIPNLFDNYLRIEHLNLDAAREAIVKPIGQYNRAYPTEPAVSIDPALVDEVLAQVKTVEFTPGDVGFGKVKEGVKTSQIEAPYLQLVMTRLWDEELRTRSNVLQLSTLNRLGGAQKIVSAHLDAVMGALNSNEQSIAAMVFIPLVTPSGSKIAQRADDLATYAQRPAENVNPVLKKLADARVLCPVASLPDQPDISRYEIFHDVLARAVLDWRARFVEAQKNTETEKRIAQERQRAARFAWTLGGVILILIAMLILAIYAWSQQKIAFSRELASNALNQSSIDPELSLLLSIEAVKNWQTFEAQDALRFLLQLPNREILRGHVGGVNSTSYSPDGKFIVTAGSDKTARVWQLGTGQQVHILRHSGEVNYAAFNPTNGNQVVTASQDNMSTVWNLNTENSMPLLGHTGSVQKITFSSDGKYVATASEDRTAFIYDASTGNLITKLVGHNGPVNSVAFSRNSQSVLTASDDSTVRIWDLLTGKTLAKFEGHTDGINTAVYDPTERYVVTASKDKTARVWDTNTGTQIAILSGHEVWVNTAQFSPDGNYIVTSSADSTARVWETMPGKEVARLSEHTGAVNKAVFTLTGDRVITVSSDGKIYSWAWRLRNSKDLFNGHENEILDVAFSPNGNFFATASLDGTARIWLDKSEHLLFDLPAHNARVTTALFSPDGKYILDASEDNTAYLWEVPTQRNFVLSGHRAKLTTATFSNDGKLIATSSEDGTAIIWDSATRKVKTILSGHNAPVTWVNFAPDSKLVVTASADKTARIWDVATGKTMFELVGHTGSLRMAVFSPEINILITASDDGIAKLWSGATGQLLFDLKDHKGSVDYVAFSPDGKSVVTVDEDKTAKVWDVATGRQLKQLLGHQQRVNKAVFSSDGKQIVTASNDNTARVWDVSTEREAARLLMPRPVTTARFSSDGQFVVTASENNAAYIWNASTGRFLQVLVGHTAIVQSAMFSPDDRLVVTAGWDGYSRVFACQVCSPISDLLDEANRRVSRSLTCKERQTFLHQDTCP